MRRVVLAVMVLASGLAVADDPKPKTKAPATIDPAELDMGTEGLAKYAGQDVTLTSTGEVRLTDAGSPEGKAGIRAVFVERHRIIVLAPGGGTLALAPEWNIPIDGDGLKAMAAGKYTMTGRAMKSDGPAALTRSPWSPVRIVGAKVVPAK